MEVRNVLDDSHEAFDCYSFICIRICVFHEAVASNFTGAGMSVTNSVKVGTGFELQSGPFMATTDNFDVQSDDITMSYSNSFQLSVTSGTAMRAGDISLSEAAAQIYTEPGVLRLSTGAATFAMAARGPLSVLQTKADVYEQVADEWSLNSGGDIDVTSNGTLSMQSVSGDLTFDELQVETDTFAIESVDILVDSSETLEMVVGNATTLTSPFVSHFSDVTLVESSESITWRTGNASLSADAVTIDSSETLEMVVGNATTLTSPFVSHFSDVTLPLCRCGCD
ncbi:hypothetical protein Naga_100483g1 [Nannochloropsis gaditana]|uniref:Uncharacterized protein n=1 Tax=Nannochloropsis gaditana TaxID=72520 RepID=W7T830_9STRA|nr:hypothetical protein Naga_100483g1 [Nannochloropsis gaditana]